MPPFQNTIPTFSSFRTSFDLLRIFKISLGHWSVTKSVLLFAALFLSSCSFFKSGITYYDPTTYRNLTEIKPQVVLLYDSFSDEPIVEQEIKQVRLRIAQMLEYEKGKGPKNTETIEQIKLIRDMFEDDISHRRKNGVWNNSQQKNQIENISDAFDIAIATERLKNKNE